MATRFGRFLKLERPHQPPTHTPRELQRFEEPLPLEATSDEQPFRRCSECEAENTRFAGRCVSCKADLHTAAQESFNVKLWEERRAQRAAEQDARLVRSAEVTDEQRRLGEAIAQQVAERERERLGWPGSGPTAPLGLRILAALPTTRLRSAFLSVCAVACVGGFWLMTHAGPHPGRSLFGFLLGVGAVSLFVPGSGRRHRRWFMDD